MTEITVETTGSFMLLDNISGKEIPHDRGVTVPHTPFVAERLANGDLRETELTAPAAPPAPADADADLLAKLDAIPDKPKRRRGK